MATIRAIQGDWSISQSVRSYFSCCLGGPGSKDGTTKAEIIRRDDDLKSEGDTNEIIANGDANRKTSYGSVKSSKSIKSLKSTPTDKSTRSRGYGDGAEEDRIAADIHCDLTGEDGSDQVPRTEESTEERIGVVHVVSSKTTSGAAYNGDDQDTSSDSDDEVLRRYQQSIQRDPSQRSLHSSRSHKSSAGKSSHAQDGFHGNMGTEDPFLSPAEKGGSDHVVPPGEDQLSHGGAASSVKGAPSSVRSGHTVSSVKANSTRSSGERGGATSPGHSSKQATYQNVAFENDQEVPPGPVSPTSTERALSNYGDGSVSLGDKKTSLSGSGKQEHLFDVSDLQDREPILISKCGNLEVTFDYELAEGRMNITIHKAQEIPSKDRGGANNTQVRILLLPTKRLKHKTKVKQGENPEFMETFTFKVPPEDAASMGVRFRLYGCERMRRERMIGEVIVGFASLNLEMSTTHNLTLEPRSNLSHGDSKMDVSSLSRSDSASSTQSMQHGGMPELLIGLTYNGTTGRLSVEVIKGSNFKNMAMNRAPDTYAKLTLMSPNGQEIARSKTSIRRGQPNPLYKETFMFQVALFQLPDVTLMVSIYNKRSMKRKEMIGWFSLGYSNSGEEELSHWNDMRESKGEPVCRWHVLLEA